MSDEVWFFAKTDTFLNFEFLKMYFGLFQNKLDFITGTLLIIYIYITVVGSIFWSIALILLDRGIWIANLGLGYPFQRLILYNKIFFG